MLILKVLRDIKKSFLATATIIVIITLGVSLWAGFADLNDNVTRIVDDYYSKNNMPHIFVSGHNFTYHDVKEFMKIPGVARAEGKTVLDFKVPRLNDAVLRVSAVNMNSQLNKPNILTGNSIIKGNGRQIMLDGRFLDANELNIGDTIRLLYKDDFYNFQIVGGMQVPDSIYAVKDAASLYPNPKEFGYAILDEAAVRDMLYNGERHVYNTLYLSVSDLEQIDDIKEIIRYKLGTRVQSIVDRSEQFSAQMMEAQKNEMNSMIGIFPAVFFTIAALISYTSLKRLVEKERQIIGTMKALGIGKYKVMLHYILYGAIYSIIGAAAGILLSIVIPKGLMALYDMYFDFPPYRLYYGVKTGITAAVTSFIFCVLAAFLACKSTLKLSPAVCMRPKSAKPGKRIFLEKIPLIWDRIGFIQKVVVRNMLRNKDRLIMSVFGIMCSCAMIFIAFGMNSTINNMLDVAFDGTNRYDIKVFFKADVSQWQANRMLILPYFKKSELLMEAPIKVSGATDTVKSTSITVISDDLELIELYEEQFAIGGLPQDGAIMTKFLAEQLDIKEGDTLNITFTGRRNTVKIRVEKIIVQSFGQGVYCTQSAWRNVGEEYVPTSVVAVLENEIARDWLKKKLEDNYDFIASMQYQSDLKQDMAKNMDMSKMSVSIMILFSGLLAFIALFNLGTLNFYEREREIATLKVLGFYKGEIKTLAFAENYLFTAVGIIIGLVLGKIGLDAMMGMTETESYTFEVYIDIFTYIYSVVGIMFFAWFTNKVLGRYVSKIDMISTLKAVE